jgi:peroxiredoxin
MRKLHGVALTALLAASGCGGGKKSAAQSTSSGHSMRLRLTAVDGGEIDLASYRGRVVVLHLFDTDSAAAAQDAEQLSGLSRKRRAETRIIGICLDAEGYPMAAAWRRALNVPYLIALADAGVRSGRSPLGAVKIVPTTIVLDRTGQLIRRVERALQPGELEGMVEPLLE